MSVFTLGRRSRRHVIHKIAHPQLGEITLVQGLATRRISLSVRPSGEIRLSFPTSVLQKQAIEFMDSRIDWINATRARIAMAQAAESKFTPEDINRLRKIAKATLPPKVEYWAEKFGFKYGRVTIRQARTKWGCCTSKNNISLSLFMAQLPEHLQNFIIIHELCHTVHHNHSKEFHALLDKCLGGNEKALRKELREFRRI